jgi:cyclic pyranopterin phosphate synthase
MNPAVDFGYSLLYFTRAMIHPSSTRDISAKPDTLRTARASARLRVRPATIRAIRSGTTPKADPLGVAKVAGIQAAKQTSLLIPFCHQVPLDAVSVDIIMGRGAITVNTLVKAVWNTGVEMEALLAASVSALTLYDMLKPIDDSMGILNVSLIEKTGGMSSRKETGQGYRAAVVVVSDSVSNGRRQDSSGAYLVEALKGFGFGRRGRISYEVLPDEQKLIEKTLMRLADDEALDLIVTTGGTGLSPRDVTPEATLAVIRRRLPGVEETLRRFGQDRLPTAMLSRSAAGVRGKTLIVNLPGSRNAAEDGIHACFPAILHALRMVRGEGHASGDRRKRRR